MHALRRRRVEVRAGVRAGPIGQRLGSTARSSSHGPRRADDATRARRQSQPSRAAAPARVTWARAAEPGQEIASVFQNVGKTYAARPRPDQRHARRIPPSRETGHRGEHERHDGDPVTDDLGIRGHGMNSENHYGSARWLRVRNERLPVSRGLETTHPVAGGCQSTHRQTFWDERWFN